jgi:hypothetical protein
MRLGIRSGPLWEVGATPGKGDRRAARGCRCSYATHHLAPSPGHARARQGKRRHRGDGELSATSSPESRRPWRSRARQGPRAERARPGCPARAARSGSSRRRGPFDPEDLSAAFQAADVTTILGGHRTRTRTPAAHRIRQGVPFAGRQQAGTHFRPVSRCAERRAPRGGERYRLLASVRRRLSSETVHRAPRGRRSTRKIRRARKRRSTPEPPTSRQIASCRAASIPSTSQRLPSAITMSPTRERFGPLRGGLEPVDTQGSWDPDGSRQSRCPCATRSA